METEKCRHGKIAPIKMLEDLPFSQGGMGRHKCATCAYQLAINEADKEIDSYGDIVKCSHGNYAPEKILLSVPGNQGGTGRHKCVVCAYQAGRANARSIVHDAAWTPRTNKEKGSITLVKKSQDKKQIKKDDDWWKKDEERLKEIGELGERLVFEYEKTFLLSKNRHDLANKVTHVSKVEGDYVGYDIRSYTKDGKVKYIEVKTTVNGVDTPFSMSENEKCFAVDNKDNYYIYRLFDLDEENEKAHFYIAIGTVFDHFNLYPTEYRVELKTD